MIACVVAALYVSGPATADSDLERAVERDYDAYLGALFDHLHRNPELSFLETKTAARIADELRALDIDVTEGVGGVGVVGMLRNGEGPTVLVRADMDGLPIKEESGLPNMSIATQVNRIGVRLPVMHACGHDAHMASLIGVARQLSAVKDQWSGTVMFIAQPAEERLGGAKAMMEDGLYERFGVPDYALAYHAVAEWRAGDLHVSEGPVAATADSVDVTVYGVGTHGAEPHKGKDPIYISAQIIQALQGLVSRELAPLEPGVVTVGSIHGGTKHNIIPDEVKMQLTIRSMSEDTRQKLLAGVKRIAEGVARTAGLPEDRLPVVTTGFESTPMTVNDAELAMRIHSVFEKTFPEDRLHYIDSLSTEDGLGAEDFAYFLATDHDVRGLYLYVGATSEKDMASAAAGKFKIAPHHSPRFRIDPKPTVTTGATAIIIAVMELLGNGMSMAVG